MILPAVLPPPHGGQWPEAMADQAGMNWMWLEEAARFATENEISWPYDLKRHLEGGYFEPAPYNEILGPIRSRGEPNGLVLRSGLKVMSWGDTEQVDFTFSAAKSYLSLLTGIAVMDGFIRDLDEPVRPFRARWRLRGAAQWCDHLAAPAVEHVRMGGYSVRKIRPDRSQPEPRG